MVDVERDDRECHICADHARVEALIERSSLGGAEAKAVRESVPNDIGIALTRAAEYLGRAKAAESKVARVEALADEIETEGWGWEWTISAIREIASTAAIVPPTPGFWSRPPRGQVDSRWHHVAEEDR